jgi:hypothetical protein
MTSCEPACDLCCRLDFVNRGCHAKLWWQCTCPGGTLTLQRLIGSTWTTQSVSLAAGYLVTTTSGNYRMRCELPTGEVYFSNVVTVTVCSLHSAWFRWHKQNFNETSTSTGSEFVTNAFGSFIRELAPPNRLWDPRIGPPPAGFSGALIYFSWGCTPPAPNTTGTATAHVLSAVQTFGFQRSGYTFDYRYVQSLAGQPSCGGVQFSLHNILPRGLHTLGSVTYTRTWNIVNTEIASWSFSYSVDNQGNITRSAQSPLVASSGRLDNWSATQVASANFSLWLPPANLWPDGSTSPTIPIDPNGNVVGLIGDSISETWGETGNKTPCFTYPGPTDSGIPFLFVPRSVYTIEATEFRVRTCGQFFAGTNVLPPSTVLATDPCRYTTAGPRVCLP